MQATTLAFEALAPIWFALRWTRPFALAYGIAMHTLIGMMFGPVAWFALLMIALLVGSYAPVTWLSPRFGQKGTFVTYPTATSEPQMIVELGWGRCHMCQPPPISLLVGCRWRLAELHKFPHVTTSPAKVARPLGVADVAG